MRFHTELGSTSFKASKFLLRLIQNGQIQLAGNKKLKIYGLLTCSSGKRMKRENRIFFKSENEAMENGFRPCGHCMKAAYLKWKELQ